MMERWLPIPGYEGSYEVSDLGRVRSLARICRHPKGGTRTVPPRILKLNRAEVRKNVGTHRLFAVLNRDGVSFRRSVHSLVLTAFRGPRPTPQHQCRHLNCDSSDNRLTNLVWGTPDENYEDSRRLDHYPRGEQVGRRKLTAAQVIEIRRLHADQVTYCALAKQFGIARSMVGAIVARQVWTHV